MVRAALYLLTLAALLAAPGVALAGGTFQVSQVNGHPRVVWDQPSEYPAVYVDVIEVADAPQTGSDGNFFSENVVDSAYYPAAADSRGEWLSASQLAPGTYFVRLRLLRSANYAWAWSASATLVVPSPAPPPNQAPRLSLTYATAVAVPSGKRPRFRVSFTVCDDSDRVTARLSERFRPAGSSRWWSTTSTTRSFSGIAADGGCQFDSISRRATFLAPGRWQLVLSVTDSGGRSRTVTLRVHWL